VKNITVVNLPRRAITVVESRAGRQGPPGPTGGFGAISLDADNRLRLGSDSKLFVPDTLTPDPLAYYILARD
jgi:hypothetical protein